MTNEPSADPRPSKSPSIAAFLSFLWPGLGQAYERRRRAALIFAIPALIAARGTSGARVEIMQRPVLRDAPEQPARGYAHLAISVGSEAAVDALATQLKKRYKSRLVVADEGTEVVAAGARDADAPGLALWTLGEVSALADDPKAATATLTGTLAGRAVRFEVPVDPGRAVAGDTIATLAARGVLIRDLVPYGLPLHVRISVGLPSENERLLRAFR